MAVVFFLHGASPECNRFDGVVQNMASYYGHAEPDIIDGFDAADPRPIKGFDGLKLLIDSDDEVDKAYICIMEHFHSGTIDLKTECSRLYNCVDTLSRDLQYSSAELKSFILECLLAFHHLGLSKDIATVPIVERSVLDKMWDLLKSFAPREDVNEEDRNQSVGE